jgi:iron(III) transport system ATP-binding protein
VTATGTTAAATAAGAGVSEGLRVSGLTKSYGAVEVLGGVDLSVPAGTLTAILGRSGCGKTTLLRLVAGFDRPDTGIVVIGGRTVSDATGALPPEDRRIGYVTQEGNLFPHLTVAGNVTFGLARRARRDARRVTELLELVGLEPGLRDRHPHELSGGQQQRVALARALAPGPGLVLLDEPFSALDVDLRESTRTAVVEALRAAGATALLVTHDQAEALSVADRVAVMREGRIVQEATPRQLYAKPADRGVAAFVGDVVTLPATVRGGVADCVLGAPAVPPGTPDGPATVLLRPEEIDRVATGGVPARVLQVEYFGHDGLVRLAVGGAEVRARWAAGALPAVGDEVSIAVRGEVAVDPAG